MRSLVFFPLSPFPSELWVPHRLLNITLMLDHYRYKYTDTLLRRLRSTTYKVLHSYNWALWADKWQNIPSIQHCKHWHFQHVAMVELMSVHFQHVVEYTTAGHGTRYVKATGGTFMPTLLDIQLISAHILWALMN